MPDIRRIASQFYNRPLWLQPAAAETISAFLLTRMRGGGHGGESDSGSTTQAFRPTPNPDGSLEIHQPRASRFYGDYPIDPQTGRPAPYRRTPEGTAIITVIGELVNRGAWIGASSGLVSYEGFRHQMLQAAKDERAKAIVIDMESPGGEATGAMEVAAVVRQVAKTKPVYAVVNGLAASAGYALISGATRIVTMPTGVSGSIGVVMLHLDFSAQLDMLGVKPTLLFAGAHKVDGNPLQPLADDVRQRLQAEVESYYRDFVETVAAGRRGLSAKAIRESEALTYIGRAAVDAGLADEVGTLEEMLDELRHAPAMRRLTSPAPPAQDARLESATAIASTVPPAATEEPPTTDRVASIRAKVASVREHAAAASTCHQPQQETPPVSNTPSTPDGWRAEYQASAALQHEFITADNYIAFKAAEAKGLVSIRPSAHAEPASGRPAAPSPDALKAEFNAPTPAGKALRQEFPSFEAYAAYKRAEARGAVRRHRGAVVTA